MADYSWDEVVEACAKSLEEQAAIVNDARDGFGYTSAYNSAAKHLRTLKSSAPPQEHAAPVGEKWTCAWCGKPATCFGQYESAPSGFACDECCQHGNEDGRCIDIYERDILGEPIRAASPVPSPPPTPASAVEFSAICTRCGRAPTLTLGPVNDVMCLNLAPGCACEPRDADPKPGFNIWWKPPAPEHGMRVTEAMLEEACSAYSAHVFGEQNTPLNERGRDGMRLALAAALTGGST